MSGVIQAAPSASQTLASRTAGVFAVGYGYYPEENSRSITAQYNWAAQSGYAEDLGLAVAMGVESSIQSVFIDNSLNPQPVVITVAGTGQVVNCAPYSMGVFPLFLTGMPSFNIVTIGANGVPAIVAATTRCYFLNFPISPTVWGTNPGQVPAAGTNNTVAVGGTAVIALTGPLRSAYISNPLAALDQGIGAAEVLYVDPVAVPGSAPGAGNGTTSTLQPGQSWTLPGPIPAGVVVRVNAATAGHKYNVVAWN